MPTEGTTHSQTLTFRDGSKQWEVATHSTDDLTRFVTPQNDVSLAQFLSRPLIISTSTWTPGVTPYTLGIDPWTLFFGNKRNINRINNFNILNAHLHLKIVVNGNPFYYGMLMADYVPLPTMDAVTQPSPTVLNNAIAASQRLHAFISPTESTGIHMELPFIWPQNGVSIPDAGWNDLGDLYIRELVPLKHANGSSTPLTITIFAWATEVHLSVPTTISSSALVAQTSEIDLKPSTIMSAAAGVAGSLANIPTFAPYALATQMVMGGLSKVAKLIGFSRPCIIDPPMAMRPSLIGELACVDKKENCVKLTADSRQELTIDPRVIGVDLPDELNVKYIAGKESYFTSFPWTIASTAGTHLFNIRVTPSVYAYTAPNYYMTAPCFANMPFAYWRGTMKYRFQIVASQYHKGRLLFLYDPRFVNSVETNVVYSRIIDLENERDFTIDVAWSQERPWLPTTSLVPTPVYSTAAYATADSTKNGVLAVYVLNELNSPNSTVNNDISINVFCSACDDIEFSVPYADNIRALAYVTQTDEVIFAPTNPEPKDCMGECLPQDNSNLVFFGEKFASFRSLLKRYHYHSNISSGAPAAAGQYIWLTEAADFPASRGVVGSGGTNAAGLANYSVTTPLTYLAPAFLAYRGSTRFKKILIADVPSNGAATVIRGFTAVPQNVLTARIDTNIDATAKQSADALFPSFSHNAATVTIPQHQPVLEYELPYYHLWRFSTTKDPFGRAAISTYSPAKGNGHLVSVNTKFAATTDRTNMDVYISVGEDFSLMMFQGAPPCYVYSIP